MALRSRFSPWRDFSDAKKRYGPRLTSVIGLRSAVWRVSAVSLGAFAPLCTEHSHRPQLCTDVSARP